jgi:cyclin-dependent kinase 10
MFLTASRDVDDYEKLNRVGEGSYGVVYMARNRKTNKTVALKRIRIDGAKDGLPISGLRYHTFSFFML